MGKLETIDATVDREWLQGNIHMEPHGVVRLALTGGEVCLTPNETRALARRLLALADQAEHEAER